MNVSKFHYNFKTTWYDTKDIQVASFNLGTTMNDPKMKELEEWPSLHLESSDGAKTNLVQQLKNQL